MIMIMTKIMIKIMMIIAIMIIIEYKFLYNKFTVVIEQQYISFQDVIFLIDSSQSI